MSICSEEGLEPTNQQQRRRLTIEASQGGQVDSLCKAEVHTLFFVFCFRCFFFYFCFCFYFLFFVFVVFFLFLFLFLFFVFCYHMHAHAHARTRTHAHTHTQTHHPLKTLHPHNILLEALPTIPLRQTVMSTAAIDTEKSTFGIPHPKPAPRNSSPTCGSGTPLL